MIPIIIAVIALLFLFGVLGTIAFLLPIYSFFSFILNNPLLKWGAVVLILVFIAKKTGLLKGVLK